MIQAVRLLRERTAQTPVCVAVHGLFADRCDELLREAGARVVTTNTVVHASNAIDVAPLLADAIGPVLAEAR